MKRVVNIEFSTDWERINAYESESIWVGTITYENGQKLQLKDDDREKLIEAIKERII